MKPHDYFFLFISLLLLSFIIHHSITISNKCTREPIDYLSKETIREHNLDYVHGFLWGDDGKERIEISFSLEEDLLTKTKIKRKV